MTNSPGQHSERAHASLGASNSSIWLNCPGSYALSHDRERKSTTYAREGTAAHEIAEMLLAQSLRKLTDTLPLFVRVEGHEIPVDPDMVKHVGLYVETAKHFIENSVWHGVEVRVRLDQLWAPDPAPLPLFGTADTLALGHDGVLTVCDLKYGKGKLVAAEGNTQLLYYGLGALYAVDPELRATVREVQFVIVQPRAGKEKIKTWQISLVDLLMWADQTLKPTVDKIAAGTDELHAGTHCFFCVAAPVCPALHSAKIARAAEAFPDLPDIAGAA